jgi:hypothetical protein
MIIRMEQFGLHRDEGGDAALAVLLALQACREMEQVTLQFPVNGRFHFHPENMVEQLLYITNHDQGGTRKIAFPLQGRRNLIIDGQGSEFIFHGPMIPFVVDHSEDVMLRNLTIDWERPMFEQGTVVESAESSFVVEISDSAPYEVKNGCVHFWFGGKLEPVWGMHDIDPVSKTHAYQSGDRISWTAFTKLRVEEAGERCIRVFGELQHQPPIGHIVAMRFGRRENPGIFITGGTNIAIEHVTVHHAPGMGLVAQRCTNIHLKHFDVKLRPESARVITATADATHFTNCRGSILMEHCLFENQLDDPCNVHGIYSRVVRRMGDDTLLVQLMHDMTIGVEIAVNP